MKVDITGKPYPDLSCSCCGASSEFWVLKLEDYNFCKDCLNIVARAMVKFVKEELKK